MRARVRVGVTSRRSSGATRSGLIENSSGDERLLAERGALAGLHLQQLVGIDGDRVGLDRRRGGDGAGDDLALGQQALDAGLDQALAELVEVEEADEQGDEAGEVEDDDAARQARGGAQHDSGRTLGSRARIAPGERMSSRIVRARPPRRHAWRLVERSRTLACARLAASLRTLRPP